MGVVTVDFDGTLYQGDSFKVVMEGANQAFGLKQWTVISKGLAKASTAGLTKGKNAFKLSFFEAFAKSFKGMTRAELDQFFRRLVEIGKDDVHQGLIEKIHEHERQGDQIIVLSGAFQPFLKAFTDAFSLNVHIIGTELMFNQRGLCTGHVRSVVNGDEKVNHVQAWMDRQKRFGYLTEEESRDTWAYADSESDVPLLEFVKHPFVVNPDKSVKKVAVEEGWPLFG
ncbi:hypothetical protein GCM10028778_07050 [Barrientosiimonas marina]|uniref:HAD family hydrolase n=2 Tax=Lentibacillus kimchii TaxID=1542911 RepID=A0ABW2UZ94_9BACI